MVKKKEEFKEPSWEHAYLHKKLNEISKIGQYLRPKRILEELKRICRVPNTLHYPILKQMEEEGLIKRINHQKYEINDSQKNKKIREINKKLKDLLQIGRRNRMLKAMEECELIKKQKDTKFLILNSKFDKKLELLGNYTWW